jgi:hypothetical protein
MIRFMLDSVGQFMANDEAYGLVRIGHTVDSSWVTGLSALKICKGQTLCDSVGLIGRGVRSPYDAY